MDRDILIVIVLWAASGALIGGVVTPLVAVNRKVNEWAAMVAGLGAGAVGHLVALVPLWVGAARILPKQTDTRLPWQRDAVSLAELRAQMAAGGGQLSLLALLKQNFWPAQRDHSHRAAYVGVFVALAILTAVEVTITYIDLPFSATVPLVILSTLKVMLVVLFFMHLRYDSQWYAWIFAFSVPFAIIVLVVLAAAV